MKKYRKYIIALLSILAVLTTICFIPISVSGLIPVLEKQIAQDYGVKAHIERLVLRLGPNIKLKTPIMHVMYEDGQKFAQFDAVKFYITWGSVMKQSPKAKSVIANNLTVRVNSDDKYLANLVDDLNKKDFSTLPNMHLKNYNISFNDKGSSNKYVITGQNTSINKIPLFRNFKINSSGDLYINDKHYVNYDISLLPKFNLEPFEYKDINTDILAQIKELDFHSDIITDLRFYKDADDVLQASGFLNIDNISVLDKTEKTPKSFVYLTLWGDKASILSNIYTSDTKKVYLEGMINNSKKPVLDLKVKTDEINLNDLFQKVKIFKTLTYLKDINSVTGTMNANFTLKGDLNKIKSSGFMKISDGGLSANGLKINKINSDIDMSNNIITINNTTGYVNKSPVILSGKIDKTLDLDLTMSKVELKHLVPESLGVKNGLISLSAKIGGTLDNITHKENLAAENISIDKNGNILNIESLKYNTNKNNTAYINNLNLKTPETSMIKIPSMRLLVDRDKITIPLSNIYMTNSKLTLDGEITNYNSSDISFNTALNGFIHSSDVAKIKTYATIYPIKANLSGNKNIQNFNSQILFEKTTIFDEPTVLNIAAKKEKDNIKIEDIGIYGHSGKFSDDFKQNLKGQKKLVSNGNIENIFKPKFKNFRIFTPQNLNINITDTNAQVKGDLFINGEIQKPEIIGQILIPNLYSQPLKLSLANCTIDFNKNIASINAPMVKIADSSMGINAAVSTDISKILSIKNINIKSKSLNTDTLLMYKDLPIMKTLPVEINEGKFYSERILADIYSDPLYMTAFSSDIKLKNDIMELKNISSEMYNGKMAGNLKFNMKDESFNSNIMARGVSASPIFDIISNRNDTISGIMDFDINLTGNLATKKSLNGDVKFIAKNGRMSTLGKLEHLLYAQNVIADNMLRTSFSVIAKALTLKDTGLFKYLKGDIKMTNGAANIKFLQSQGPLMSLFIKGVYFPDTDYAKLTVLGRLSDEVISGMGAFGEFSFKKLMVMLTGEDNKYNITTEDIENLPQLPVKNTKEFRSVINGTIDKPSSVQTFNWISYSEKSLKQRDVPTSNIKVPSFVDELPY